jgi:hypothetical protein
MLEQHEPQVIELLGLLYVAPNGLTPEEIRSDLRRWLPQAEVKMLAVTSQPGYDPPRTRITSLGRLVWEEQPKARPDKQPVNSEAESTQPPKGKPGRRGYPVEAWNHARKLREHFPNMKAAAIRRQCLKHFPQDDVPRTTESFRSWLNRRRTNRTN